MTNKLMPNTTAPALSLPLVGGGTWTLADQMPEMFSMVIFYRGLHCPVCRNYLNKLKGLMDGYTKAGFSVVIASMNDQATAEQTVAEWDIADLPMADGLTEEDARAWGLYISKGINEVEAQTFCEPGTF